MANAVDCGECCIVPAECGFCGVSCVPRYLCATAHVTLADPEIPCCDLLSIKLIGGCRWSGSAICPFREDVVLAVYIEIVVDYITGLCTTVCTTNHGYGGTNQGVNYVFSFTVMDTAGNQFDVTTGAAGGFANPLTTRPCSPCTCASCLPPKLCATLQFTSDVCGLACDSYRVTRKLTYDPLRERYGPATYPCGDREFTLTIKVPDCVEMNQVGCSLIGRLTGPVIHNSVEGMIIDPTCTTECVTFKIVLEARDGDPDPDHHGFSCREGTKKLLIGEPGYEPWAVNVISAVVLLYDNSNTPLQLGSLIVSDGTCGDCVDEPNNCVSGCPEVAPRFGLNLFPCPPVVLIGEFIAPGCKFDGEMFEMTTSSAIISSTGVDPNAPAAACVIWRMNVKNYACGGLDPANFNYLFTLYDHHKVNCKEADSASKYSLAWAFSAVSCNPADATYSGQKFPDAFDCKPFFLEFTLPKMCFWVIDPMTGFLVPGPGMCTGDTCDTFTIRITK